MTLYRQIAISIILLLVLGFTGVVAISTNNLRDFLLTQFESHAQDTATSLGLSLSQPMQSHDMSVISSMVDVVFDRGYYREIQVRSNGGETLVSRTSTVEVENIPDWFIRQIDLPTPTATAVVMSGWTQAASVTVISHPGYAYRQLWTNAVDTFWLFLVSAAIILIGGLGAVYFLLRPLRQVELQADAICNRSYIVQPTLPRTRELRRVVIAMNRLSEKIHVIFSEQSALTERLREQAYKDPVTNLGNRHYLDRQLHSLMMAREDASPGALLLLELNGLAKINESSGYPAGDLLLQRTGELISTRINDIQNCFAARISGACFAIVAVGLDKETAGTLARRLCQDALQLRADGLIKSEDIIHIGIAMWTQGSNLHDLLSEADIALRAAQSSHANAWQCFDPPATSQADIHGNEHWRRYLQQAIDSGNVTINVQPVVLPGSQTPELLHKEVLLRIPGLDGNAIKAGVFMPMAEHLGLASEIDKLAIREILNHMASEHDCSIKYAVNLSSTSLHDRVFTQWLCRQLKAAPDSARRLLIEFPEYGAIKNIQETRNFIARLGGYGCQCGIDHFGRGFYSFSYLRSIKIHYVKVDGSYTRGIDNKEDNQFFLQALVDTAHSIDIKVIAQAVETEAEHATLLTMNLDGIQGYLTGKPEQPGNDIPGEAMTG